MTCTPRFLAYTLTYKNKLVRPDKADGCGPPEAPKWDQILSLDEPIWHIGETLVNDDLVSKYFKFDKSDQIYTHTDVVRLPTKTYFNNLH